MSAVFFHQKPEFTAYTAGAEHTVNVLITVIADRDVDSGRAELRVSAALDRSGSMSGKKLELVKNTMNFVLRQLEETDKLGLVSYHTTVNEEAAMKLMTSESKQQGNRAVRNLRAGSSTNLSGGLFQSIDQIKQDGEDEDETNPGPVSCVLLLTDGLPNVGISNPRELESAVSRALEGRPPIKLHTFGYGRDHNAQLLQRLAEIGNGNFYYINKDDDMPTAFADAIGGLLSVVVQNISFEIRPSSSDISIEQVLTGFKTTRYDDGSYKVFCNDLYSKERKDVMVRLKVPAVEGPLEAQAILEASLRYFEVSAGKSATVESVGCIKRTQEELPDQVADEDFVEQNLRINVYETLEEVAEMAAVANYGAALCSVQALRGRVGAAPNMPISRCVQEKLADIEQDLVGQEAVFDHSNMLGARDGSAQRAMASERGAFLSKRRQSFSLRSSSNSKDQRSKKALLGSAAPVQGSGALWSTVHEMKNQRISECFRSSLQSTSIEEALEHNKQQTSHEGEDGQSKEPQSKGSKKM